MAKQRLLPFEHPDRRSADVSDIPGVVAETQRLYDLMRIDVAQERHGYGLAMLKILKELAGLLDKSDLAKQIAELKAQMDLYLPRDALAPHSNGRGLRQ